MAELAVVVDLSISADEYLAHYSGAARDVIAKARDGRSVRFPSSRLQPFVTHGGINGAFKLVFDQHNRLTDVIRIA